MITKETHALQAALDYATLHPDEWDQTNWARPLNRPDVLGAISLTAGCGTAACLAGTGALQAGYAMISFNGNSVYHCAPADRVQNAIDQMNGAAKNEDVWMTGYELGQLADDAREVPEVAAEVFGVDGHLAEALFESGNRLLDLWTIACVMVPGISAPCYVPAASQDKEYRGRAVVLVGMADRVDEYVNAYESGSVIHLPYGYGFENDGLMNLLVDSGESPWREAQKTWRAETERMAPTPA